ncbi:MAG: hypothetical protein NXI26_24980 [bacterium]|nr:hypothetical protein [bacterium]
MRIGFANCRAKSTFRLQPLNTVLGVMDGFTDHLGVLAEFSIGLAGFTGIIAALTKNADEIIQFRFQNLLASSFAPGFFALIVIGGNYLNVSQSLVLVFSSALLAVYIVAFAVIGMMRSRKLPFGSEGLSLPILRLFAFTGFVVLVLQILGLLFLTEQRQGFFFYGLVLVLFQGAVSFIALALSVLRSSQNDA